MTRPKSVDEFPQNEPVIAVNSNVSSKHDLLISSKSFVDTNLYSSNIKANNNMDKRASELASKLFNNSQGKQENVVKHLTQLGEFHTQVAKNFMEHFQFFEISLDESLRIFLRKVSLTGETHERERLLHHFAIRYNTCNPEFLHGDIDTLHVLVCAIALLNTDLHGAKYGGYKKMTRKQFISNLAGVGKGEEDLPTNLLKDIYRSINKNPLPWCGEKVENEKPSTSVSKSPSMHVMNKQKKTKIVFRSQSMNQPNFNKVQALSLFCDDEGKRVAACRGSKTKTLPRKQGVLWKKSIINTDGTKTSKRKRRWKLLAVALQGLELHLAKKDTQESRKLSLHHSLAEVTNSDTKRENVFRLTLADLSVMLYQASSKEDVKMWVRAINRNAALLSASPLSAGVGSQLKFQRPLLPSACSTLPLAQQLYTQQEHLDDLCSQLDDHRNHPPVHDATSAQKRFYKEKQDFLRHEVHKYEVYTNSLCEIISAEKKINSTRSSMHEAESSSADNWQSLLSVSPSEPGTTNNLSSYPSSDNTASTTDLSIMKTKKTRTNTSLLSPTSSLPNLQPTSSLSTIKYPLNLVSVDDKEYKFGSFNKNNSNFTNVNENGHGMFGTLPREKDISALVVTTSYLTTSCTEVVNHRTTPLLKNPPAPQSRPFRVRGRKERKGLSRHSYLHAVKEMSYF